MKLSEALRLGSVLPGYDWEDGAHCACGKAFEAIGLSVHERDLWPFGKYWAWAKDKLVSCPANKCKLDELPWIISHLASGFHDWPMSKIADWVESIEPACPATEAREEAEEERKEEVVVNEDCHQI